MPPGWIRAYQSAWIPPNGKPDCFNGDLILAALALSGLHGDRGRKGGRFNILDAASGADHVGQATSEPSTLLIRFPFSPWISLNRHLIFFPPVLERQLRRILAFRIPSGLRLPFGLWITPQRVWPLGAESALIGHLLAHLQAGGSRRAKQFIYGFDATGSFPNDGIAHWVRRPPRPPLRGRATFRRD